MMETPLFTATMANDGALVKALLAAKAGQVDMDRAERDVRRMEGIICAMTPLERRKPELIKASRKRRIAAGAGVPVRR